MPAKRLKRLTSVDEVPEPMNEAAAAAFYGSHSVGEIWEQLEPVDEDLEPLGRTDVEAALVEAVRQRQVVQAVDAEGRARSIEPHAIFLGPTGDRQVHSYQVGGYAGGGKSRGWKNLKVEEICRIVMCSQHFKARRDYHPDALPNVEVAIPKHAA